MIIMAKVYTFLCLCFALAYASGQRITTIQLDGVQYFISRMNPYSPELNYFLAYQYCRSLGLQLASFETKEKVESMTSYLQNAGYSKYDFWTSGNRLGTGMFLWMSTGLQFNATFDYFENSADSLQAGGLVDSIDHNGNTAPQRTARDSNSGLDKGCVILKAPSLKWTPEDCSAVKDFICEQTRCYYYNYGSIPVSSAQGRRITPTSTPSPTTTTTTTTTTTPLPPVFSSRNAETFENPKISLQTDDNEDVEEEELVNEHEESYARSGDDDSAHLSISFNNNEDDEEIVDDEELLEDEGRSLSESKPEEVKLEAAPVEDVSPVATVKEANPEEEMKVEKVEVPEGLDADIVHPGFLSLTDLIKTLRPQEKKIPQIDSDYSNTMRVLGDTSA